MEISLKVGQSLSWKFASELAVVEEIYPAQPLTGRALYKVKDTQTGLLFALKVFDSKLNPFDSIHREMVALNRMNTPASVPRALGLIHAENNRSVCLLLDWMPGKPLSKAWPQACDGTHDLKLRMQALQQACKVLQGIHQRKLIHRDLKPDNILVADASEPMKGASVIDFGMVAQRRQRIEGTPGYQAPEQEGDRFMNLNAQADIFALGQVGWTLVTGYPREAYPAGNDWDHPLPTLKERHPFVTTELDELFAKAMAYDPRKRFPNAGAMGSALGKLIRNLR